MADQGSADGMPQGGGLETSGSQEKRDGKASDKETDQESHSEPSHTPIMSAAGSLHRVCTAALREIGRALDDLFSSRNVAIETAALERIQTALVSDFAEVAVC